MRSRASRLTVCTAVWLAFGAAAYFLFTSEQSLAVRRSSLRAFDLRAREAVGALTDLRAAQQAYVAAGQGVAFWMPRASALIEAAAGAVTGLSESAASSDALVAIVAAGGAISEFGDADERARDYLKASQPLMAADIVFTEGSETSVAAVRHVETASVAEHQEFDAFERRQRRLELYALATAGGVGVLATLVLALTGSSPASSPLPDIGLHLSAPAPDPARPATQALTAAAELCTEFGRVKDPDDLTRLLARAAELMNASGLIVWLGSASGADLRPVLAQGYPPQTLARMPAVPRTADNAAAAAYRTGRLQIVLSRPGSPSGALVAPLLSPDGCVGALAAEIKEGGEGSDRVQALAALFAAQLTAVLGGTSADAQTQPVERAASS